MRTPHFVQGAVAGTVDQALLSAFNLGIGIAFIKWATKEEYAAYSMIFAGLLLLQSIQNALVNSPLLTLLPARKNKEDKTKLQSAATGILVSLVLASWGTVILLLLFCMLAGRTLQFASISGWAIGIAATGLLLREYVRGTFFLRLKVSSALLSDAGYVTVAAIFALMTSYFFGFSAEWILASTGGAAVVTGLISLRKLGIGISLRQTAIKSELPEIWGCAKWALPSVVVSWLYSNAYVYVVDWLMARNTVADLAASRLLLVPISLVVVGWSSSFRPRASKLFAQGDIPQIDKLLRASVLVAALIYLLYGFLLWLSTPLMISQVFSAKYAGLESLIVAWGAFFFVNAVRCMGMSAVLSSKDGFRPLYLSGWMALLIAAPLIVAACFKGMVAGVVWAMVAAECVLASVIWGRLWPCIRIARQAEPGLR